MGPRRARARTGRALVGLVAIEGLPRHSLAGRGLMNRTKRVLVLVTAAFMCVAASPTSSGTDDAKRALSVLARTKTTSATYSLYSWNKISPPDRPSSEEWSAEFNDGPLHRVETPENRLIANCLEKSGSWYSVATSKTFSGPRVAGAACGINTDKPIISIRYIGRVSDGAVEADRVEVTDPENIRTYDVTSDGILIRTIYALNTPERPIVVEVETEALTHTLPQQDMFDAASLSNSVVPDAYKKRPASWP